MAYVRPALTTLQKQALSYLANYLGVPAILPNSDEYVLAYVMAGFADDLYGYLDFIYRDSVPTTAIPPQEDMLFALVGIIRNAATYATGTVSFTGSAGVVVPSGSVLSATNNQTYATTADFIIGTTESVPIEAVQAGSAGNAPANLSMSLINPITGVQTLTAALTAITGGTDVETNDSLRTRGLLRWANTPQGGSLADYQGWLAAVPGVTRGWVLPSYIPGPGSVTLYPMFDSTEASNGGFPQGTNGISEYDNRIGQEGITLATEDLATVANSVWPKQNLPTLVWVQAPTPQAINVTISGLGSNNTWSDGAWSSTPTTIQANILSNLQQLFLDEGTIGTVSGGTIVGGSIPISSFYAFISSVSGVSSYTLVAPTATVATAIGSLPILGTLTIST